MLLVKGVPTGVVYHRKTAHRDIPNPCGSPMIPEPVTGNPRRREGKPGESRLPTCCPQNSTLEDQMPTQWLNLIPYLKIRLVPYLDLTI